MSSLRLLISTPAGEEELPAVRALRFPAGDGLRGILPGHEPGRAMLREGPIRVVEAKADARPRQLTIAPADRELEHEGPLRWLATEGGVVLIDRHTVRILTRWAAVADTLAGLRAQVEARDEERSRLEQEARILARRHELATRRALVALQRKVTQP